MLSMRHFGREDPGVLSQTGSCSGALFALAFLFSAFASQDPAEVPLVFAKSHRRLLTVVSERRATKSSARPGLNFDQRFAKVLAREQVRKGVAALGNALVFVG